jgi:hypothetical protein
MRRALRLCASEHKAGAFGRCNGAHRRQFGRCNGAHRRQFVRCNGAHRRQPPDLNVPVGPLRRHPWLLKARRWPAAAASASSPCAAR